MAFQEKRAWVMALVSVAAYAAYVVVVLGDRGTGTVADSPYVGALLWTVGAAIVANIVLQIPLSMTAPRDAGTRDQRDREIYRFGEYVGQSFLVVGGVGALIMAMAEAPHFWIANTVYLAFGLSAACASVAKLAAYRRGLPAW